MQTVILNTVTGKVKKVKRLETKQVQFYKLGKNEKIAYMEGITELKTTEPTDSWISDFIVDKKHLTKNLNGKRIIQRNYKKPTEKEASKKLNDELWDMFNTRIVKMIDEEIYLLYSEPVIPVIYQEVLFLVPIKPIEWYFTDSGTYAYTGATESDHPHISGSNICFGDYLGLMQTAENKEMQLRQACQAINDYNGKGQYSKSIRPLLNFVTDECEPKIIEKSKRKVPKIIEYQYGLKNIYDYKKTENLPKSLRNKLQAGNSMEAHQSLTRLSRLLQSNIGKKIILNPKYYNEIKEPSDANNKRNVSKPDISVGTKDTRVELVWETDRTIPQSILSGDHNFPTPDELRRRNYDLAAAYQNVRRYTGVENAGT